MSNLRSSVLNFSNSGCGRFLFSSGEIAESQLSGICCCEHQSNEIKRAISSDLENKGTYQNTQRARYFQNKQFMETRMKFVRFVELFGILLWFFWISLWSFLDFLVKGFGFLGEIFWILRYFFGIFLWYFLGFLGDFVWISWWNLLDFPVNF